MTTGKHPKPKDVLLEALIQERIRQMGTELHVLAKDGQVTLTGIADDFKTKREIDTLVEGIGGVREVINKIVVASVTDVINGT